jgi:carbonic anhydrase
VEKLIQGLAEFKHKEHAANPDFYQILAQGQSPETLFITCADSRINPNLLTMTQPGELFIIRNAGNMVPPHGAGVGGEAATVEYAVAALRVKDIIVCGHTDCGAMKAIFKKPEELAGLPAVGQWLRHADTTREVVKACHGHLEGKALERVAIEANVRVQIDHLKTHPTVAASIARGELSLHGWVYDIGEGTMHALHPQHDRFELIEAGSVLVPAVGRPSGLPLRTVAASA